MNYRFVALDSEGEAFHSEDWNCASDEEAIDDLPNTARESL